MPEPTPRRCTLDDFDFELPPELIAQHPAPERSGSRLLDGRGPDAADRIFRELPSLLAPGDLLVFNDTRVIRARLYGRKSAPGGQAGGQAGGRVELLVERVLPGTMEVWAHVRASKSPRPGSVLHLEGRDGRPAFDAEVLGRCGPEGDLFHLRLPAEPLALLEAHGHVPLPPYIEHADDEDDERRYQTVFARTPGAVAAPTAALHFDEPLLRALGASGIATARITLHVGAGTFQPVRARDLSEHRMHSEWFEVPQDTVDAIVRTRAAGGRVVAVGTTTLRALESAARPPGGQGGTAGTGSEAAPITAGARETDIFITPGFDFRVVDVLITNFHLPRSTLMVLVSAFAGHARIHALYAHAVRERYRFFSYGDAMLLEHAPS